MEDGMYGTISRLRVKPGMVERLQQRNAEVTAQAAKVGLVFAHMYQTGAAGEMWLVVAFESEEAYRRNAASPEQHQRYLQLRDLLEADPEWHDGEIVFSHPG